MPSSNIDLGAQPRWSAQRHGARGFTLIELIVVVILVGVLAAIAVPRFIDMGRDARIAAVNTGVGTVATAASLAFLQCKLAPTCDGTNAASGDITGPDGAHGAMHYGYPDGRGGTGYSGIIDWVQLDDFAVIEDSSGYYAYFDLTGASDPTNCKVNYLVPGSAGLPPVVSAVTSGC